MKQLSYFFKQIIENKEPENLYNPINYVLSQEGKRLRPQLVYISTQLFNGSAEAALYPAAAFELLHNFTLIHDDIMDHAPKRRGKPTVYKKWNTNIAILSGNALASIALRTMLQTPTTAKIKLELSDLLSKTSIEICEGQQYDIDFEKQDDVSIDEYLYMIKLKTAVMLAGCLKAGAILSQTSVKNQKIIYEIGINIGIAFQLKDDLLDVYGENTIFGKINGGDIKENKKTYPLLCAMQDGTPEQRLKLLSYLALPDSKFEEKFILVKRLYQELAIKKKSENLILDYGNRALNLLNTLVNIDPKAKEVLQDWITRLKDRDK